ncbi:MAG: dienelactone hydrolase [Sphingomonas bacterium]|uniref:alpha/beta hydrolase n=1 Tax=Sphingomonas bacterium TaxID=1895847 RepID=UPI00262DE52F|nr:alpha/beta hydrolase [Sphingomonas bacterium]MDB5710896.1 dienelactone hydrolase [Sphingomonas bacterium]
MIDRRSAILGTLAAGIGASAAQGQTAAPAVHPGAAVPGLPEPNETIDLWPAGAPGAPAKALVETVDERSKDSALTDRAVYGISRPRMVVFRPAIPNGSAVLAMPGGGYRWVVIDKEGYEIARWLSARGYTVFVLFYRLPGEGWAAGPDVALSDAQRAMRLIRHRARDYGIVPERVAAMGFSAGGHVCGDLATRFATATYGQVDAADRLAARPDVAASIYGVQSMSGPLAHPGSRELLFGANVTPELERAHSPALNVGKATPPCFLVHAEDDPTVPVENSLQMRAALKAAGVPVETHLFTSGGHGFGLRRAMGKPAEAWPELFAKWAQTQGLG